MLQQFYFIFAINYLDIFLTNEKYKL